MESKVVAIYTITKAGGNPESQQQVEAEPGKGLRGDRYWREDAAWSKRPKAGREVTLIEMEAIKAAGEELHQEIGLGDSRRNIVTQGVRLNDLVGTEFRIGPVKLRGEKLCDPCNYLGDMTSMEFSDALKNRGGLRTSVVEGGNIRVGDPITLE